MKTVIVSGATRGLGLHMVKQIAAEGYRIVAIGRNLTSNLAEVIDSHPQLIAFEKFDLSNLGLIHAFATRLVKTYGRPWALINNAALGSDGILATQHESDISNLIRLNIESPILLTKYILRPMLIQQSGRIINVSSIIANTGFSGLSVYAATKASLIGFTKSLAREVGKRGITVNAVAPGYMATDLTKGMQEEKLASISRRSALGRLTETSDVASAVVFLLSENAKNVTGTTLTIDAGSTA